MHIIASLTVDNWGRVPGNTRRGIHWMGKGSHGGNNCEWLLRLYRVP